MNIGGNNTKINRRILFDIINLYLCGKLRKHCQYGNKF